MVDWTFQDRLRSVFSLMKKPQTHRSSKGPKLHLLDKRPKTRFKDIQNYERKHRKALRHTVSNSDSFPVFFSECSSHFCQVIVHPTLDGLRKPLCEQHQNLEAYCVPHASPRDSLIATIHLCRQALACSHICHECLHAAWHRAKVLGIKDEDDFQEFVAYGQAALMVGIADWITENVKPIENRAN